MGQNYPPPGHPGPGRIPSLLRRPNLQRRTALYARYSQLAEWPLIALALIMVANLLVPDLLGLSSEDGSLFDYLDWLIYGLFFADTAIKLYLAPSVLQHLRHNWLDVVILALPLLRPLRIIRSARLLRFVRLARIASFGVEGLRRFFTIFGRRQFHIVLAIVIAAVLLSAGFVDLFENGGTGDIHTYLDALWWAVATVTTVGYGDATPVTPEGRLVAIGLMIVGIAFYGILTANIAAYFLETDNGDKNKDMAAKLDAITSQLASLQSSVAELNAKLSDYPDYPSPLRNALPTLSEATVDEPQSRPEPALK